LRAGTGNQVSYTEGAFLRFIYGPNLTKNTSKKIENFNQTVLASGDVSEFEKKNNMTKNQQKINQLTKTKFFHHHLSANSQWKKGNNVLT